MRYAYHDLGEQPQGTNVVVRWADAAANVVLLDPVNFRKYVERMPVVYGAGGRYGHPPARLSIRQGGHWYVVVDLLGRVTDVAPTVEVDAPPESEARKPRRDALVER